jgi:hypothetical protein
MPRKLRIQYPGAMYHVMSRGDRREKIFLDDIDRQDFIKAARMIAEELQRHGWKEQDLVSRRKNDPTKLEIAARLRRETTLSVKEIAARAHLGTSKTANTKLHKHMRGTAANDAAQTPLGI